MARGKTQTKVTEPEPDDVTTDEDVPVRVDEDAEAADRVVSDEDTPEPEPEPDDVTTDEDTPVRDDGPELVSTASPRGRHPRDTQHPSLGKDGDADLEIAERTIDIDTASGPTIVTSANHRKVFVLQAAEWDGLDDEGKDAVHFRNQRAVRQFLLSQGLRVAQDADVTFAGEERIPTGRGGRSAGADSVALTYETGPTPAVLVSEVTDPESGKVESESYELVHMVVTDGPRSATEEAEWEARSGQRALDAHKVRAGTAEVAR